VVQILRGNRGSPVFMMGHVCSWKCGFQ